VEANTSIACHRKQMKEDAAKPQLSKRIHLDVETAHT